MSKMIVIFVELTVDPAVGQRAIDRFGPIDASNARVLLGELDPRTLGFARLPGQPAVERRQIDKGQNGKSRAHFGHVIGTPDPRFKE